MKKRGLFITVEGTDGSGKTTQISLMKDYIEKAGFDVLLLREPGGTRISEKIRELILNPEHTEMAAYTEVFLYAAARAQVVAQAIKPALEEGKVIICDRFVHSTYAYQGFGRGLNMQLLEDINKIAVDGTMPDITFLFDADPEVSLKRRTASGPSDRIENENLDFHRRVYLGYLELARREPERIKKIDSGREIGEIWAEVKKELDAFLKI